MDFWFTESQSAGLKLSHKVKRLIHKEQTPFQELSIVELEQYGRALILDDIVQTTIADEFVYHEMITHMPLNTHQNPQNVLIVGGGDGGAVRECLKHSKVKKVTLVEIDERVVENSKEYLPEIACGLNDDRVTVKYEDGIKHVSECNDEYDVILIDSPDPIGPAVGLYGEDFYKNIYKALKKDGILVAQTESPWLNSDLLSRVTAAMCDVFPIVKTYWAAIPVYQGGFWSFTMASKEANPLEADETSFENISTRYYHPELHKAVFQLPKFVKDLVSNK